MKPNITTHLLVTLMMANISCAQEDNQFTSVPIIPSSHPNITMRQSAQHAEKWLSAAQNADGSFGQGSNNVVDTSLVLLALTRNPQFGAPQKKMIASASEWIRKCEPKSDAERIAVVIALSGLHIGNQKAADEANDLIKQADFSTIQALLTQVDGNNGGVWRDALALTKLPDGIERPTWAANNKTTRDKYGKMQTFALETLDDYLAGYLHAIVKSWDNDRNMEVLAKAVNVRQNDDGSLKLSGNNSAIGSVALVALYPSVYYKTAPTYFSNPAEDKK